MGSTGRNQWYLEESNPERFSSFHSQIHNLICSHTRIVLLTRFNYRCSVTHIPHRAAKISILATKPHPFVVKDLPPQQTSSTSISCPSFGPKSPARVRPNNSSSI